MKPIIDTYITAQEICELRQVSGWDHDLDEWESCIRKNLINVSVREAGGKLVGVGFLSGNVRHAELTDLVVLPDLRNKGVGRDIVRFINDYAINNGVKYYGLSYDKTFPWLKEFYESEGFKLVDFAMWHNVSLK